MTSRSAAAPERAAGGRGVVERTRRGPARGSRACAAAPVGPCQRAAPGPFTPSRWSVRARGGLAGSCGARPREERGAGVRSPCPAVGEFRRVVACAAGPPLRGAALRPRGKQPGPRDGAGGCEAAVGPGQGGAAVWRRGAARGAGRGPAAAGGGPGVPPPPPLPRRDRSRRAAAGRAAAPCSGAEPLGPFPVRAAGRGGGRTAVPASGGAAWGARARGKRPDPSVPRCQRETSRALHSPSVRWRRVTGLDVTRSRTLRLTARAVPAAREAALPGVRLKYSAGLVLALTVNE